MAIISTSTHHEKYTPTNIFIGGLGYVGSRLASTLHEVYPHAYISGTVRSAERRDGLLMASSSSTSCIDNVHVLDIDNEYIGLDTNGLHDLLNADTIIQTIAPLADFDTDPLLAFHSEQLLRELSGNDKKTLKYVIYISSTGVYGNHNGDWVSEEEDDNDVLLCTDTKSLARIKAEKDWGKLEQHHIHQLTEVDVKDTENHISIPTRVDHFRCGGIYGPGRGPLFSSSLESLLTNDVQSEEDEDTTDINTPIKYVNRILVDDICSAVISGMNGSRPIYSGGRAYNCVDDDPAPRRDVVAEARRLLSSIRGETPTAAAASSTTASSGNTIGRRRRMSRGTGNKRCKNTRLKEEYGWEPIAPTYREGLVSLLDEV